MAPDILSPCPPHPVVQIAAPGEWSAQRAGRGARFSAFPARITPNLAGAILVSAGLAKTHQLWTEGISEPTVASWGFVALIQLELAMGLALLAKMWPAVLRGAALLLFAAFLGVALSKAAAGAKSCGCAGNVVEITPWAAALVDAIILVALWRWQPVSRPAPILLQLVVGIFSAGAVALPLAGAFRPLPYPRLVTTHVTDLGVLAPGERRSFRLHLENPHDKPVELLVVESSCPCLETQGVPCTLAPRQSQVLRLVLDLSREPGVAGSLMLEIAGKTAGDVTCFLARVSVTLRVKRSESNL